MKAPFFPRWIRKLFRSDEHWLTLSFFRGVPLFHGLSSRQLTRVMLAMQKRSYRTGEVLFQEGQEGKAVFIIQSGQVELTRTVDQKPRSVGIMKPGQMFGEMALLEQMKRSATATVVEDGDIYLLYTTTLETLIKDYPSIGVKLLRNMAIMLSALLRRTNRELDERMKSHS